MAQDVDKGRKTEVNQMNGYIVEKGMEAGIATPVNEAVVRLITDIESGKIKPDPSHADRILDANRL